MINSLWDGLIVGAEMDWKGHSVIRVDALAWDGFQQRKPKYLKTAVIFQFFLYVLLHHFEESHLKYLSLIRPGQVICGIWVMGLWIGARKMR